jgi:hypothetical protein
MQSIIDNAKCQCRYNIKQYQTDNQYQCRYQHQCRYQYQDNINANANNINANADNTKADNTDIDRGCYAGSNIARLLFANVGSILMRCRFCREHAASSPKGKLCCGGCGRRTITFLNTKCIEKSI